MGLIERLHGKDSFSSLRYRLVFDNVTLISYETGPLRLGDAMMYFSFNEFVKLGECVYLEYMEMPVPKAMIYEIYTGDRKYVEIGFIKEIPCEEINN